MRVYFSCPLYVSHASGFVWEAPLTKGPSIFHRGRLGDVRPLYLWVGSTPASTKVQSPRTAAFSVSKTRPTCAQEHPGPPSPLNRPVLYLEPSYEPQRFPSASPTKTASTLLAQLFAKLSAAKSTNIPSLDSLLVMCTNICVGRQLSWD